MKDIARNMSPAHPHPIKAQKLRTCEYIVIENKKKPGVFNAFQRGFIKNRIFSKDVFHASKIVFRTFNIKEAVYKATELTGGKIQSP
jgi:hypothetical protein